MNGIHDLGGMDGMGPVVREENEPVFHAQWERRMFANTLAMLAAGYFRTDEIRRAVELIPPGDYLRSSYYERWLAGLTTLLLEKDVLTPDELETGRSLRNEGGMALPPLPKEAAEFAMTNPMPANVDVEFPTRFAVGEPVVTRNMNPLHHTRIRGMSAASAAPSMKCNRSFCCRTQMLTVARINPSASIRLGFPRGNSGAMKRLTGIPSTSTCSTATWNPRSNVSA